MLKTYHAKSHKIKLWGSETSFVHRGQITPKNGLKLLKNNVILKTPDIIKITVLWQDVPDFNLFHC